METQKNIPDKIRHQFDEDETVIWSKGINQNLNVYFLPMLLLAILSFFFLFYVHVVAGTLIAFSFSILAVFFKFYKGMWQVATQKRIYFYEPSFSARIQSYSYERIYKITNPIYDNDQGSLVFHTAPNVSVFNETSDNFPQFKKVEHLKQVKKIITEAWFNRSPYQNIITRMKTIAKKYDLEFHPFYPGKQNDIILKGKYNDAEFILVLFGLYQLKKMSISISIPQATKNYFLLKPENLTTSLGKIIGSQDIKIGNPVFDDRFLIQSSDPETLHHILDENIREKILNAWQFIQGEIKLGEKEKFTLNLSFNKKDKMKDDDILDSHLTAKNPNQKIGLKDQSLIYHCNDLQKNTSNENNIIKGIENVLDVFLELYEKLKN